MKPILSEKNIVVVLFVMVLITFSLAQEDSKKIEKGFTAVTSASASKLMTGQTVEQPAPVEIKTQPAN
jgi:hypothetical protein